MKSLLRGLACRGAPPHVAESVGAGRYGLKCGSSERGRAIPCSCLRSSRQTRPLSRPGPDALHSADRAAPALTLRAHPSRPWRHAGEGDALPEACCEQRSAAACSPGPRRGDLRRSAAGRYRARGPARRANGECRAGSETPARAEPAPASARHHRLAGGAAADVGVSPGRQAGQ